MKWKVKGNHVYSGDEPLLVATYGLGGSGEKQKILQLAAAAPEMRDALLEIRKLCNQSRGDTWALVIYNLIEEVLGEEANR